MSNGNGSHFLETTLGRQVRCFTLGVALAIGSAPGAKALAYEDDSIHADLSISGASDCGANLVLTWSGTLMRTDPGPESFQTRSAAQPLLSISTEKCEKSRTEFDTARELSIHAGFDRSPENGETRFNLTIDGIACTTTGALSGGGTISDRGFFTVSTYDDSPFSLTEQEFQDGFTRTFTIRGAVPVCGRPFELVAQVALRYRDARKKPGIEGPHCLCGAGKTGSYTARMEDPGGAFDPFDVKADLGSPAVASNKGGPTAQLTLSADPKRTGQVTLTATYRKGGKSSTSDPFIVHFCSVDRPEVKANGYSVSGTKQDFSFSGDNPGHIEFDIEGNAWLDGQVADDKLRWDITPASYLQKKGEPGRKVTFFADALPPKNNDFGDQQVKSSIQAQGCTCESNPAKVRLFYRLIAHNSPQGDQMPNWNYYYGQTSARQGIAYTFVKQVPNTPSCASIVDTLADPEAVGNYDYCNGIIYVAEPLMISGCPGRISRSKGAPKYIDCFASTLKHEHQHQLELTKWWGPNMSGYNLLRDPDHDLVPTDVEEGIPGCNPYEPKSCRGRPGYAHDLVTDIELDAYTIGWQWPDGSVDGEDWACPGKQCPNPEEN